MAAASTPQTISRIPTYGSSMFSKSRNKPLITPNENEAKADPVPASESVSRGRRLQKPPIQIRDHRESPTLSAGRPSTAGASLSTSSKSLGLGIHTAAKSWNSSSLSSEPPSEKPRRHVLRRKQSSINQHSNYARTESTASSHDMVPQKSQNISASLPGGYQDPYPGSVFGVTLPSGSASTTYVPSLRSSSSTEAMASSVQQVAKPSRTLYPLSTQNLSLSTPRAVGCPSSPSTRCSESPGPFSRASTPTSMSSHSPALLLGSKANIRTRQLSPTRSRPPVTLAGRKVGGLVPSQDIGKLESQGLPALRESLTSSSSGSTVKAGERGPNNIARPKTKKIRLSPPPPSPPLRKSSKKFSTTSPRSKKSTHIPETSSDLIPHKGPTKSASSQSSKTSTLTCPSPSIIPPTRPSRAGISNLEDQYRPSPIIHSNLSHLQTTGHKRRESMEKEALDVGGRITVANASLPHSLTSPQRLQPLSRIPSRQRSPSPGLSYPQAPSSLWRSDRGMLPPLQPTAPAAGLSRGISPTSAGSSKSISRFGLFSRRTKTTSSDEAEKSTKKGPVAGTGHEGYGKYARRGRSGSASTSGSGARSSSAGSASGMPTRTTSARKSSFTGRAEPEIDGFFLERLTPVVLSGGGAIVETRNIGTETGESSSAQGTSRPSSIKSKLGQGLLLGEGNSSASASSSGTVAHAQPTKPHSRPDRDAYPSDASEITRVSALAARRSLYRSQTLNDKEPMKIPTPIETKVVAASPSLNSYETIQSSVSHTGGTLPFVHDLSDGKEGFWLKPRQDKPPEKSSRRWNFFERAQRSPQPPTRAEVESRNSTVVELPVTITPRLDARPIAHYAMFDDVEQSDVDALEDSLHENEEIVVAELSRNEDVSRNSADKYQAEGRWTSPLLPSRPVFPPDFTPDRRPASPKVMLRSPEPSSQQSGADVPQAPRPSRLPQVGRIPRVISKRDRTHQPPVQSFSRPFAQQPRPSYQPPQSTDHSLDAARSDRPVLGIQTEPIPAPQWDRFDIINPLSAPAPEISEMENTEAHPQATEFLTFPPRKGSEVSGSSSSGVLNFSNTTALLPKPDAALSEDEVWGEYDDLLDNVLSTTAKTPLSTTSSLGAPFQYANLTRKSQEAQEGGKTTDALGSPSGRASIPVPPVVNAAGSDMPNISDGTKLSSPLPSAALPSTPLSFTEFFAGYEERNVASDHAGAEHASPSQSLSSSQSAESNELALPATSGVDKSYYRNPELMNFAEKERDGPEAQTNLRFAALMTNRWLSFGRVLFSPAHAEIRNNRQDRILILDGLGNDDWSFYCSLTYPDATIYNLSPYQSNGQLSPKRRETGAWQPPTNHRQIHHTSIAHPFPFPKGFFTAVVLRFPVADSEAAYRNAVSECKRVLRPGGYLEISVLDLDMMNMGNRARRAVRMLKVRMQVAHNDVSLKPVSDNIQKMLGRRGFENLNRCMVGVPVAGKVSESRSGSFDDKNISLSDMIKDQTEQGDEGITKMVAKVGRWWYTRCYELGVLPDGDLDQSIWQDKALLKECEKRETSFKLLICYAQKPLAPRRRTVSV